jgi:hypothetical protein
MLIEPEKRNYARANATGIKLPSNYSFSKHWNMRNLSKNGRISPRLYSHPNKQMTDYYHLWYSVRTKSGDLLKSLCPVTENKILSCKPCNGKGKVVTKTSPQGHNLCRLNSSLI